jgi:hypothetical protein
VLDGIGVSQARFFEELLKVVLRQSCLALAISHSLCSVFGARATHPLVNATIVNGCGLLATLFVPLLASLGTLLGTVDGDAEQHNPTADRGWLKSCCLGTTGMMGGDATLSFCGALGASVNTWRHHESAPPCARFLVVLASVPLGSWQDLLCPLGSS